MRPTTLPRTSRSPRALTAMLVLTLGLLASLPTQAMTPIPGETAAATSAIAPAPAAALSVFRDPLILRAQSAVAWNTGHAQRPDRYVWLTPHPQNQPVFAALAQHGYEARQALVRLRGGDQPGSVRRVALVLERARSVPVTPVDRVRHDERDDEDHDASAVRTDADQLLVTAATTGPVQLTVDRLTPWELPAESDAPEDDFVRRALERLARFDATPATAATRPETQPQLTPTQQARRDAIARQVRDRRERLQAQALAQAGPPAELADDAQAQADRPSPPPGVLPARGVVSYAPGTVVIDRGDDQTTIALLDGVTLLFEDFTRQRSVTLRSRRAVVFLRGDEAREPQAPGVAGTLADDATIDAGDVIGVYLEDNAIVTDGQYTVRAPRVYYDLAANRAMLLEAVMYTHDVRRNVPLYVRADVLRQSAAQAFEAEHAVFTTSAFAEPHVALAASRITVAPYETRGGRVGQSVSAADLSAQINGTPVLWLPRFRARGAVAPLRSVSADYSSQDGPGVETSWDAFGLLGVDTPDGVDAELQLDFRGQRGPGVGIDVDYATPEPTAADEADARGGMAGSFRAYALLDDHGEDEFADRQDIEHDGDTRGFVDLQHRQTLPNGVDVSVEAGYVSDETVLEEFFPRLAEERKPFETSVYVNRRSGEAQLTALLQTDVNAFLAQTPTLQSRGYTIDRLPELQYHRLGTPLLDGRITWYSHNAAAVLAPRFSDRTPADYGFTNQQSLDTFGFGNATSFEQNADANGFPTDQVLRFDSRQEFAAPIQAGPIDVTPFAVARLTAYDDDFDEFSGNGQPVRLWGQAGTRLSTELHRAFPGVQNGTLDLDGLRHVLEPHATLSYAESSQGADPLPVFDENIESLTRGGTFLLGLNQTLQTRRGGPGRTRTVDWVQLRTAVVFQTQDEQDGEALGRFVDYRPEASRGGDHAYTELRWQVSDILGLAGEATYDFQDDHVTQWRVGSRLRHSQRLGTSLSYEEIDPLDSRLIRWSVQYQLTTKYAFAAAQTLDVSGNRRRTLELALDRQLPQWRMRITASFDQLNDEQSVGFRLIPQGLPVGGFATGSSN